MEAQARRGGQGASLPADGAAGRPASPSPPPPEARAVAAHPRAAAVLRALEDASKGLYVISESDEPFLPFAWPADDAGPFSPAALAARYGGDEEDEKGSGDDAEDDDDEGDDADETPAFTVEPAAAWFERAARAAEVGQRTDEAAGLRTLARLMAERLNGAVAVRVGGVGRVAVFLLGAVRGEGEEEEQEEEDLGVFAPDAQIVGLETAQVET